MLFCTKRMPTLFVRQPRFGCVRRRTILEGGDPNPPGSGKEIAEGKGARALRPGISRKPDVGTD